MRYTYSTTSEATDKLDVRNESGPVNSLVCSGREGPETKHSNDEEDGTSHQVDRDTEYSKDGNSIYEYVAPPVSYK